MNHQWEERDHKVALVPCAAYDERAAEDAVKSALDIFGGLTFIRPGMKVGIKANLVTGKKPETAATTHPALLAALVKQLTRLGAEVIVGDSPGGIYSAPYVNGVYAVCGLKKLEEIPGCRLNQNFSEADMDFPEGIKAKRFHYVTWVDECDVLINFSKLKTHGMMGMSCACKNMFGMIPGTYKAEYHFRYNSTMDFARMILDLNRAFPCELYLVDAVVGMEGNGPTAGTPRQVGCLMASRDPFTLDSVCARLMGLDPMVIPTVVVSREAGLLPDNFEIVGNVDDFAVADYKNIKNAARLVEQSGNNALFGKWGSRFLTMLLGARPKADKAQCVGCGKCAAVCPAKAIEIRNGLPVIERKECIRCFCCQEFCPKGAMKVERSFIAKIAGRF